MSGLASKICDLALRLMPADRREWGEAMRVEVTSASISETLSWACGCFWTALSERMHTMTGNTWRSFQPAARWALAGLTFLYGAYRMVGITRYMIHPPHRSPMQDLLHPGVMETAAPSVIVGAGLIAFGFALAFRRSRLLFASALILAPVCLLAAIDNIYGLGRVTGGPSAGLTILVLGTSLPPLIVALTAVALLWRESERPALA